jgi:hypothetical protein
MFRMEIEEDNHNPAQMHPPPFPVHLSPPSSNGHNSFGGVRRGFNSGSNRTSPYPQVLVSNSDEHLYRPPPMRSVPNDPCLDSRLPVSKLLSSS